MPALNEYENSRLYPLKVIKNKGEYEHALRSLESVFDEIKGDLAEYAETLTVLIEHYESENFPIKNAGGIDLLKFLLKQNGLKQKDLVAILGSKSSVSDILSGNRPLNIRHIKALAHTFNVEPATFL
jgi:HTH-type transcriptional regulator / antitoxin HigA